jgi:BNR repeat-like domain
MTRFVVGDRRDLLPKRPGRYRSFPGWCRTASGDILLVYRDARAMPGTRSHGIEGDLVLMRQTGGAWSEPQVLHAHEGELEEMGCGDLTCLSSGTILLWSRPFDSVAYCTREVCLATSCDDGRTFSPRAPVRLAEFPNSWVPYGKVIELPSGDLLTGGYGCRDGEALSASACLLSVDRGASWQWRSWIADPGDGRGLNYFEPFMLRLPDGEIFCLLRTNGTFYATRSSDEGRTWEASAPAFSGMACAGLVLSSGALLITFRGIHEAHPEAVREAVTVRSGRLYCCRTSADGGRTWSDEVEIDGGAAHQIGSYGMGDVLEMPDGSVRVVYYTSDADQTPWLAECRLVPLGTGNR